MWPPFLNGLYTKDFAVGGYSWDKGFRLNIGIAFGRMSTWRTVTFAAPPSEYPTGGTLDIVNLACLTGLMMAGLLFHFWVLCLFSLFFATHVGVFSRHYKVWHWCEHQMAAIIEDEGFPSEGLMRSQTPVSILCGSVAVIVVDLLYASWAAVPVHLLRGERASALLCLGMAWSALCAKTALSNRKYARVFPEIRWLFIALAELGLAAFLVCMAGERVFTLRRPSRQQVDIATRWGRDVAVRTAQWRLQDAKAALAATKK